MSVSTDFRVAGQRARGQTLIFPHTNAPLTHTGDTLKTKMASFTIPGGSMGKNGVLRFTALYEWTNNANTKTFSTNFGQANIWSISRSTSRVSQVLKIISNRNDEKSQAYLLNGSLVYGATGGILGEKTIDTTVDQTLDFYIKLANAADTGIYHSIIVELMFLD